MLQHFRRWLKIVHLKNLFPSGVVLNIPIGISFFYANEISMMLKYIFIIVGRINFPIASMTILEKPRQPFLAPWMRQVGGEFCSEWNICRSGQVLPVEIKNKTESITKAIYNYSNSMRLSLFHQPRRWTYSIPNFNSHTLRWISDWNQVTSFQS